MYFPMLNITTKSVWEKKNQMKIKRHTCQKWTTCLCLTRCRSCWWSRFALQVIPVMLPNLTKLLVFCWFEQSTYNAAWGLPEYTLLLVFLLRKLNIVLSLGKSLLFFGSLIVTSQVCLYIWDAFIRFLRKINYIITSFECQSSSFHPFFQFT